MSTAILVLLVGTAAIALVLFLRRRSVGSDGETVNRGFRDSVWTSSGGVYEPMYFDGGGGHHRGHGETGGSECVAVEGGSSGDSGSCGGDSGGGDGGGGGGGGD